MTTTYAEIKDDFEFLDEWEDRYRFVIDLGKSYEALPEDLRSDGAKVEGCASQVWLVPKVEEGKFSFQGASDAMIVQGLIAILSALYHQIPLNDASKIDALEEFAALGLDQHLSAQRSNGLRAMITRIKEFLANA